MTPVFVDTTTTVETPAQRRARQQAERRAKAEVELQETLDLVTAMFWNLERGGCLTDAQIAACYHDHVLGCLWYRVWDYAVYCNQRGRINRIAQDDETSIFIIEHQARCSREVNAWKADATTHPAVSARDEVYAQALRDGIMKPPKRTPRVGDYGTAVAQQGVREQSTK